MLRSFNLVFMLIFCISLNQAVQVSFNTITIPSTILLFLCMTVIFVTIAKQNKWSQDILISVAPGEGYSSPIAPIAQGGEKHHAWA